MGTNTPIGYLSLLIKEIITMTELFSYRLNCHILNSNHESEVHVLEYQAEDFDHAVEQVLDHYRGNDFEYLIKVEDPDHRLIKVLHQTGDNEFHLKPSIGSSCFITVGSVNICIKQEDEGVVVDLFSKYFEDRDSITSTYTFFFDALNPEDE